MNQFKWGIRGGVILVLFAAMFFFLNTGSVKAENNTTACTSSYVEKTYVDRLQYTQDGNVIHFSGATGLYYRTSENNTNQYPDADGNFTLTIAGNQLEVQFFLQADDGACSSDTSIVTYTLYAEVSSENELYNNEICVNYRQRWGDNETMKNAVPYCFSEYTMYQYSYDQVASWIQNAETAYNDGLGQTSTITKDELTNVEDVTSGIGGVCNYYTDQTELTYSHVETDANGGGSSCRQTCKETLTITFNGPVAAQAGMCIAYAAEVRSQVVCEYAYTAPMPTPTAACVPTAACYNASVGETTKGGPSENFDQCIMSCDGGEYSQSCIDTCYAQVYENDSLAVSSPFDNTNGILTYNSKGGVQTLPMADSNCLDPWSVDPNNEAQIQALYQQHITNPGGSYVNGHWVPGGSCSSTIGQYYFSTLEITRNTVNQVHGNWVDQFGQKTYCASDDGFLRACLLNGAANWCNDTCVWVNRCPADSPQSQAAADALYQQQVAEYNAAKQSCESKNNTKEAICSNEKVLYRIDVDNGANVNETKNYADFSDHFYAEQTQGSTAIGGSDPTIVRDTSGLCMGDASDTVNHYRTLLTFADAYANNKSGQVVTKLPAGYEELYTPIGNQFCTKLTSVPTNTAWYVWKVDDKGDVNALTAERRQKIEEDTVNNIHVGVENFGYFGWNINLQCFYSVINPNDPPDPDGDDPGENNGNDPTKDFLFRAASLDNLFPNDREPNFNWSCDATNLINSDYPVQPVATKELIEDRGESIYNKSNEGLYLDYYIEIGPEDINKIRDYNEKWGGNYSEPSSDSENVSAGSDKTAGVTVYRSPFLHNYLGTDVVKRYGLIGCNNQATGGNANGTGTCDIAVYQDSLGCYNEYMSESVH